MRLDRAVGHDRAELDRLVAHPLGRRFVGEQRPHHVGDDADVDGLALAIGIEPEIEQPLVKGGNRRRVFAHNRDDLLSLVALVGWLGEALQGRVAAVNGFELAGLGRLWEPVDLPRALDCYRAALDTGLPAEAAHAVRLRLARWEKRQARWDAACALWEAAAGHALFDPQPWEELAKFHEHRQRDLVTARAVVESALGRAHASRAPTHVLDAFQHRLGRLDRRLGGRPC